MASIRISPDVEAIAQKLAEDRGMGSGKAVIEAVFRLYWQQYRDGQFPLGETPSEQDQQSYQVIRG